MLDSKYTTAADIAEMQARGYDIATIEKAMERVPRTLMRDDLISRIRAAFHGVTLGNGVGLFEGQAIDDYMDPKTRAAMRADDEKEDWTKLTPDLIYTCQSSISFFDPEGLRFHLPAFMITGLMEENDFVIRTFNFKPHERFALFSPAQHAAARDYLLFMTGDLDAHYYDREQIDLALSGYWSQ